MKPKLLSLFCGAGGACMGYHNAGFDVTGIDNNPKLIKHYPWKDKFIFRDAIETLNDKEFISQFDVIHASPPCQAYSKATPKKNKSAHADMIDEVRELLIQSGKFYIIENVETAPVKNYVMLCGTMFGLDVIRHRKFECFPEIYFAPYTCNHRKPVITQQHRGKVDLSKNYHCVVGKVTDIEAARIAMGIDWMPTRQISQAIPPAYTKYLGEIMIQNLNEQYLP